MSNDNPAEPEWSTRPVPSSDTPSDERDEVCGSMGPRIGDEPERPRCAQPLDHDGQHRGFPGSGFESVQWGGPIMRDGDFARTYRPDPPPTPVDGDSGRPESDLSRALRGWAEHLRRDEYRTAAEVMVLAAIALDADRPSPVGEERRPVDVTALPEWAAFVKRHQHEPTTEDLCAQSGHAYAGDDAGGGRCYCGQTEYPLGGSSRADRRDRA